MTSVAAVQDALAHVATAVSVVTTVDSDGKPRGVTVGTLCSLSLAPPLVMFCLKRSGGSHQVMTTAGRTLIHVLSDARPRWRPGSPSAASTVSPA